MHQHLNYYVQTIKVKFIFWSQNIKKKMICSRIVIAFGKKINIIIKSVKSSCP